MFKKMVQIFLVVLICLSGSFVMADEPKTQEFIFQDHVYTIDCAPSSNIPKDFDSWPVQKLGTINKGDGWMVQSATMANPGNENEEVAVMVYVDTTGIKETAGRKEGAEVYLVYLCHAPNGRAADRFYYAHFGLLKAHLFTFLLSPVENFDLELMIAFMEKLRNGQIPKFIKKV